MADMLHGYFDARALSYEKSHDVAILLTFGTVLIGLCLAVGIYAANHTIDLVDPTLATPII